MHRRLFAAILSIALLPSLVLAEPIVHTGTCANGETCYTGIDFLEVDGSYFNVTWVEDSFANLAATAVGVSQFVGTGLAQTAAETINEIFIQDGQGFPVFQSNFATGGSTGWVGVWVVDTVGTDVVGFYVPFSDRDMVNGSFSLSIDSVGPYAIFSAVSVPEPGTLALFALALLGAGLARRTPVR